MLLHYAEVVIGESIMSKNIYPSATLVDHGQLRYSGLFAVEIQDDLGISAAASEKVMLFILQICWLVNRARETRREKNFQGGHWWTYQSTRKIQREWFPSWSIGTVNKVSRIAVDAGYLISDNYNEAAYDRTIWYRPNYKALNGFNSMVVKGDFNSVPIVDNSVQLLDTPGAGPVHSLNTLDGLGPEPVQSLNTPVHRMNDYTKDSFKDSNEEEESQFRVATDSPEPDRLPMSPDGEIITDLEEESFYEKLLKSSVTWRNGRKKLTTAQRRLAGQLYRRVLDETDFALFIAHQMQWSASNQSANIGVQKLITLCASPDSFEAWKQDQTFTPADPLNGLATAASLKEHPLSLQFTDLTDIKRFKTREWDAAIAEMVEQFGVQAEELLEEAYEISFEWPEHIPRPSGPWSLQKTMMALFADEGRTDGEAHSLTEEQLAALAELTERQKEIDGSS